MSNITDIQRRVLFILHRGLVEARLLANAAAHQQLFDLADALEPLPGWIAVWKDEYLTAIRENLETYSRKYPGSFEYAAYLDRYDTPAF